MIHVKKNKRYIIKQSTQDYWDDEDNFVHGMVKVLRIFRRPSGKTYIQWRRDQKLFDRWFAKKHDTEMQTFQAWVQEDASAAVEELDEVEVVKDEDEKTTDNTKTASAGTAPGPGVAFGKLMFYGGPPKKR